MQRNAPWICGGLLGASLLLLGPGLSQAQTFSSGSTGADGAFTPACTPTPCTVTVPLPKTGIFNFTTINIPTGVTVTFPKNAANTSVTLLATGDVVIGGRIVLDGQAGGDALSGTLVGGSNAGQGGPGGFDGGTGGTAPLRTGGRGLGPGAGGEGVVAVNGVSCRGGAASYGTSGMNSTDVCTNPGPGPTYGSAALLPLIGGSGGGGERATRISQAGAAVEAEGPS